MCFFVVDHRCFTWGQTKQYDKTNNKLSRSHAILVFYVISKRCISNFKPQLRGSWLNFLSGVDGCISSSFMQWTIYPPRWGQQPITAGTEETRQCFQYFSFVFYLIIRIFSIKPKNPIVKTFLHVEMSVLFTPQIETIPWPSLCPPKNDKHKSIVFLADSSQTATRFSPKIPPHSQSTSFMIHHVGKFK